jgi:hypothetical protein
MFSFLHEAELPEIPQCAIHVVDRVDRGRNSSVGTATGYGLDGPGIESRWGARFFAHVQTSPGYRVFPRGKAARAWC